MITFESRQSQIKFADTIARKAHSAYPHVSVSKITASSYAVANKTNKNIYIEPNLIKKVNEKMAEMRSNLDFTPNYYFTLIREMKKHRVANCFEEATLSKLIGNINGVKNIYVGDLFLKGKKGNLEQSYDHTVAFITDKKPDKDGVFRFKNREAVIVDPWLGVADFSSNYFAKLKNLYGNSFVKIKEQLEKKIVNVDDIPMEIVIKPSNYEYREVTADCEKMYPELIINKK